MVLVYHGAGLPWCWSIIVLVYHCLGLSLSWSTTVLVYHVLGRMVYHGLGLKTGLETKNCRLVLFLRFWSCLHH